MEIRSNNIILNVEKDTFEVKTNNKTWKSDADFQAHIILNNGRKIKFENAKQISVEKISDDLKEGVLTRYRNLKRVNFAFDTMVWIEKATQNVYFEWIVVNDNGFDIKEVVWPAPIKEEGCIYLPYYQGIELDTTQETKEIKAMFTSLEASMDFVGMIDSNKNGYMIINETPWDSTYTYKDASLQLAWLPSLGKMQYRRTLRYCFMQNTNMEALCAIYKQYKEETNTCTYTEAKKAATTIKLPALYTIQDADGSFTKEIMCAKNALLYIKANIDALKEVEYVNVDGFANREMEECIHPHHKMSRKECMEARSKVFKYLKNKGYKLISEGCADWVLAYVDCIYWEEKREFGNKINLFEEVFNKNNC